MKINKQTITIIGLAVALAFVAGFFGMDKWAQANQGQLIGAYQQGYEKGATDFFNSLFQNTDDCKVAPLSFNNITRNLVDTACLTRPQAEP